MDIVLLTIPYTDSKVPPSAPAILKAVLDNHGYSSDFIDFNAEILNSTNNVKIAFRDFAISHNPSDHNTLERICKNIVDRTIEKSPNYVGMSIFTYNSLEVCEFLCLMFRIHAPWIKIILGGQGLGNNGINSDNNFAKKIKQLDLCDYWIKSEGERALIDILEKKSNSTLANKNEWIQIVDPSEFIIPNYDCYDWALYTKVLPITGSRGCVRKCTFCDIHTHWKKFVYREGEDIAREMIKQSQRYGIYRFMFTDSLVNGSMKAYRSMIQHLAHYNDNVEERQKIKWNGQFIFRPIAQMSEQDWLLTAQSGAEKLSIGIESFSEEIRNHIKKKFSNQDILDGLELMKKYNVRGTFLMIVGYITETDDHINEAKEFILKIKKFRNLIDLEFGATLGILPGTVLHNMYGDTLIPGKYENDWVNCETGSTLEKRLHWLKELKSYSKNLNFVVNDDVIHESLVDS